jgi:TRAP-type uncharacterized transport system fused permease subunit
MSSAFAGYMFAPLKTWERWVLGVAAILFVAPSLAASLVATLIALPVVVLQWLGRERGAPARPA